MFNFISFALGFFVFAFLAIDHAASGELFSGIFALAVSAYAGFKMCLMIARGGI